ncbi:hypothetical protein Zmor_007354 [Zophobas morio]|uniref:Uncharacterized protein n=1 Tax=Zophobas morio TaxID=2755281 RepID=A0AA38ITS4_9CUCU|nr:hypothetical protein Zmor_007354 [Zophobas morio]
MKVFLRNKPVRRRGTTPMGFLVCAAMIGDSSSVTATAWRSLKKSLEAEVAMSNPEKPRLRNLWKGSMALNRGHLRDYYYSVNELN